MSMFMCVGNACFSDNAEKGLNRIATSLMDLDVLLLPWQP